MFNRILVPLDGSLLAEGALAHAEMFARVSGGKIMLLQVLEPISYHENPIVIDPISWKIRKAEADMYLQSIAGRVRANLGVGPSSAEPENSARVEYCIREGKTAENIVDFAHAEQVDLLVISTHGSGGLTRWNISSVTQKVLDLIYLPVLLIRAYDQSHQHQTIHRYNRILLPIDSSRRAEYSLSAGIELARGEMDGSSLSGSASENSKLLLAAVIQPPELPIPEPIPPEISELAEQLLQISRQAVEKYLNELKERLPVPCEICIVESTNVAPAIQDLAETENIDLVILCAHGHSGQATWPYGTITSNYLLHGTKPVLVIQDVSLSRVKPGAAQVAAQKSGKR